MLNTALLDNSITNKNTPELKCDVYINCLFIIMLILLSLFIVLFIIYTANGSIKY